MSNVVSFSTPEVPKDFSTLKAKADCYQKVWREWGRALDPYEQVIALQLIDRTIGWGKREAYFSIRALLSGDGIYAGVNMSQRKLFYVLSGLEKKGVIRRRRDRHVPDRVHFTVNMDWSPDMAVAVPKRLQKGSDPVHDVQGPLHDMQRRVHHVQSIDSSYKPVSQDSSLPGAAAPVSLANGDFYPEKSGRRTDRERVRGRYVPTNRADSPQANVDVVEASWRHALVENFPGTAYRTWGVREKAQVKTVLKNWRGDVRLPEFVTWAVTNWTAIMRKQFKWMTRETPPAVPTLSFFIALITQFADCRAEHKLEEWLTSEDRTQIERMMGRGMTHEQATAELAKTKAIAVTRNEMTKREVQVRARARFLDGKEKQLEAREKMGDAPPHPRSRRAEEIRRAHPKPTVVNTPDPEYDLSTLTVPMVDPDRNPFD